MYLFGLHNNAIVDQGVTHIKDPISEDQHVWRDEAKLMQEGSMKNATKEISHPNSNAGTLAKQKDYQATQVYITPWVQCRQWCDAMSQEIEV